MLQSYNQSNSTLTSNLLFMRRRQAADLLLSIANEPNNLITTRNMLIDALQHIPTECFIADDWHDILRQVTNTLLNQEKTDGARMPTQLSRLLASIELRLSH